MNVIYVFFPQYIFRFVKSDVLDCAITSTSKISHGCMLYCLFGQLNSSLFLQIPIIICIQHSLRECTPTAYTEYFTFQSLYCLSNIDHVQIHSLVVEPADHAAQTQPGVCLWRQHRTQLHGGLFNGDLAVLLESHEIDVAGQEVQPVLAISSAAGHGAKDVVVHFENLHDFSVGNVGAH